jgi:competence protein ComEC
VNRPATGIAFGLISGILIASYVPVSGRIYTAVLLLAVSALLFRQTGKQALIALVILAALTGIWQVQRINEPTVLAYLTGTEQITESHQTSLEIELLELRSYKGFNARYNARLTAVVLNGHRIRLGQRVIMDLSHYDWGLPPYPAGTKAIAETFIIKHNLNEPQEELYLNAWRTQGYHAVIEVPSHTLVPLQKKSLYALPARIRTNAERLIDEQLSGQGSRLMKSIFFGNQGYLDRSLRDQFSRTGTAHIIAVSGLHVGILALVMHMLLEKSGAGKRLSRMMTLILIWFYAAMSGFPRFHSSRRLHVHIVCVGFFSRTAL